MKNFLQEASGNVRETFETIFERRIPGEEAGSYANMAMVGGIILSGLFLERGNPMGAEVVSAVVLATCYKVENALPLIRDSVNELMDMLETTRNKY